MKNFKIGGVPEHFNYPWRLAIEDHAFDSLQVALHWSDMNGGTGQMIKGLETGSLDIAVLLSEGITRAIIQGLKAKIVDVYVESPLTWGVHVPMNCEYNSPADFKTPTFAISRYGSGSHLMAFELGKKYQLDPKQFKFNIIGDVYGGIWALENHEADMFLWEKYTTSPFVQKGSCKRIGQVQTPWPCFVLACRTEIFENEPKLIKQIAHIVKSYTQSVKSDPNANEAIAWRYHLKKEDVSHWLKETQWNEGEINLAEALSNTVAFLSNAELILPEQEEKWQEKLF